MKPQQTQYLRPKLAVGGLYLHLLVSGHYGLCPADGSDANDALHTRWKVSGNHSRSKSVRAKATSGPQGHRSISSNATPARSIRRGRQLFQRKFTLAQGLGPRVDADSSGNIHDNAALGAGLTDSCATCHGRPRGSAGFGGDVATRARQPRCAPSLWPGTGRNASGRDHHRSPGAAGTKPNATLWHRVNRSRKGCVAKKITYGSITAHPDGTVDTSAVEGVDADLRVRPFFAQGATASMREFIIGAFKDEMGMEVADPILCAVTDPANPQRAVSPAGFVYDPAQDTFKAPSICDPNEDGDGDGVVNEIDPALLDHLEFYLLKLLQAGAIRRHLARAQRIGNV